MTLAGDPSRYGQTVKMGPLTYTSPLDQKSYTLPDVTGYVHDTGRKNGSRTSAGFGTVGLNGAAREAL